MISLGVIRYTFHAINEKEYGVDAYRMMKKRMNYNKQRIRDRIFREASRLLCNLSFSGTKKVELKFIF